MNYGEKFKLVNDEVKVWKIVWFVGQGVGNIDDLFGVDELVVCFDWEYCVVLWNMDCLVNCWLC